MASFFQNTLISKFQSARDYFTPVLTTSQFYEKGQLTPEEFVNAGEFLIRLAPGWKWTRGDVSRTKSYLPPEKQYLVYKQAPCRRRVTTVSHTHEDFHENIISMFASEQIVPELPTSPVSSVRSIRTVDHDGAVHDSSGHEEDDEDYGDLSLFMEPGLNVCDLGTAATAPATEEPKDDEIRYYELSIVYDNYYRTPRVYLRGFTTNGRPLGIDETMEDVMQDYVNKTATIEAHPHTGIQHVSIHPCRHAETMKRIVDVMISNNDGRIPSVSMYMFLFIKFIGSVIPTIEYDNTMPISMSESSRTAP